MPEERKQSGSFLKKRTKKLLALGSACRIRMVYTAGHREPMDRSFLLLFFKKEALPIA
jgi:hypothetical protein